MDSRIRRPGAVASFLQTRLEVLRIRGRDILEEILFLSFPPPMSRFQLPELISTCLYISKRLTPTSGILVSRGKSEQTGWYPETTSATASFTCCSPTREILLSISPAAVA